MIKITNKIKVDMKKGQYKILGDYFKSDRVEEDSINYNQHLKKLYKIYISLPADIERFEALAMMDEMDDGSTLRIRLNAETRTLDELAGAYRKSYEKNPELPLLKEMMELYESLVIKYK